MGWHKELVERALSPAWLKELGIVWESVWSTLLHGVPQRVVQKTQRWLGVRDALSSLNHRVLVPFAETIRGGLTAPNVTMKDKGQLT